MDEIIHQLYSKMTPLQHQRFRHKLSELARATECCIRLGTGCSGTDLLCLILEKLIDKWNSLYGFDFTLDHVFSVDKGDLQQRSNHSSL